MALGRTAPDPDGLIHHRDRGSQHTSLDFVMAAGHAGLQLSFGPPARERFKWVIGWECSGVAHAAAAGRPSTGAHRNDL
jgi:transposase InsO family protein